MSKQIQLSKGKYTIVDDEDFEYLNQWKWCAAETKKGRFYAFRKDSGKSIFMHRLILNVTDKKIFVDHRDGDSLNNQKFNIRLCNNSQNSSNRGAGKNNTSGFKGVFWNKRDKKWGAKITVSRAQIYLGYFDCPIEAAKAYNNGALKHHGQFANLNQIPE